MVLRKTPNLKGDVVNDDKPHEKREQMKILRSQMLKSQFKEAMRSASSPVEPNDKFNELLMLLDEAEKKQR